MENSEQQDDPAVVALHAKVFHTEHCIYKKKKQKEFGLDTNKNECKKYLFILKVERGHTFFHSLSNVLFLFCLSTDIVCNSEMFRD